MFIEPEVRRTGPGLVQFWHSHDALEFNLILAGQGVLFLDRAHYELSPGALVWLLPNQSHRLLPGPDLVMWVYSCPSDRCDRDLLDDVGLHPRRILAREDAIALDRLFSHISQDADSPALYRAGLDYALRSARHIAVSGAEAPAAPLHPAVAAALRTLRDWPDVPNAGALAAKCGVSQDYLRELLVEQTGLGFVEWRNRCRLERFQILYPESGDLLTAALAAGFGSYTQFHRVFSETVGVTPGEWVKGPTRGAAPPVVDFSPVPERASGRMIWYRLAEVAIPDAGRWFDERFAEAFSSVNPHDSPPVETGVEASHDLRRYEADVIAGVAERDPEAALLLKEAFRRKDVIASAAMALSQWSYGLGDLAALVAAHLALVWTSVHGRSTPSKVLMDAIRDRVRRALSTNEAFQGASLEERQRAAAAVCIQGAIARSALVAAVASGRRDLQERVVAAVRSATIATYGWDPSEAQLPS